MAAPRSLKVRVAEVVEETDQARSLVLEPVDGADRARLRHRPGQFVTVRVPGAGGESVARCYSLSSSPERGERPTVTVKRTEGGRGSTWICDTAAEGDVLEILPPSGVFTPRTLDENVLLLAAGSGITPVMSILKSCLHAGSASVVLVYANRDERSVIFRDELAALAREHGERLTVVHWLESVQGLPSMEALRALARPHAARTAYLCGPRPFMDAAFTALAGLGMPRDRIRAERFFSLAGDPFEGGVEDGAPDTEDDGAAAEAEGTVEVELDGAKRTVAWPRSRRLLDVLLDAGVDAPFSCREGACSACACVLLEGRVDMARNEVLDDADLADGLILACQSVPLSEHHRVTYDG